MKKNYSSLSRMITLVLLTLTTLGATANTYTVTSNSGTGAGSLNQAIIDANGNAGPDVIEFNLPSGGSMTIALTTGLPTINGPVFINGYSQPGSVQGTIAGRTIMINIDGTAAASSIFTVNSTGVEIAGLAIYKSQGSGISISGGATAFVWGNYIGTDSTGLATSLGNSFDGVVCNTFNGTPNSGITIGVDGDNVNDANEGNLICANGEDGIFFWTTENSRISGNIIGLNKNGAAAAGFGNVRNGILATAGSNGNLIGTDGDGVSDNLEGNRICSSGGRGLFLGTVSNNNIVAGNTIGLDATNTAAGNLTNGVEIDPGSSNRIGTNADGVSDAIERNVIASNTGHGILIVGGDFFGASNSNDNIIAGNSIGTNSNGTLVRGNSGFGVYITTNNNNNANNNIIGANEDFVGDDLEGNIIANNSKGIVILPTGSSTATGNRISRNSIYDNTSLGIDLNDNGVTANDNGDGDTGPNELHNFPFMTYCNVQYGNLNVTGTAPAGAIIEFYIADAGGTEGRTYLFSAQEGTNYNGINDDSTGTASYSDVTYGTGTDERFGFTVPVVGLPVAVPAGTVIIAIATKSVPTVGSTSEFGPAITSTLPVRLLQFNGRVDAGQVFLNWATADELNNSHFEIERSANGTNFSKAGSVASKGGNGNSYNFIDTKPLGAVTFYRLKQVDLDGRATYSRVLLIRSDLDKIGAKITPNPFSGSINISFQLVQEESLMIRLYNQNGQLVKQQVSKAAAGMNTINLSDLNNLPAGNYTVELKGDRTNFRQQVIKH
ncbi:MAG: T9SS type A sorting domain-containing protein [Chitinophagaceae bacterium]|nr:T9SS type A sorting domain-containing protein [Chitinophagaceae bacterium]